uniref:RNA-directed DNA polymerase, eukaryota, reverse transcriptase zinc-binding domain protein n=1 Tax=Tanacetum cinerariifolium TaxID=118510 RepID=A0A6L2NTT8_TANCI|nr:RNA-directed DNA polymerase, eukaryota, reverse transcriptase zinc-binding domain protein [Tanacetum cinerariifolium]
MIKRMHPNKGKIAELDANEDVTLEDVDAEVATDANIQGRLAKSQAKVYHLDLQHAKKVLSMQDTNEAEPVEVEEVIKVVTAAKLITEVVTTAATTIIVAQLPKASAPRRRRGVVIQELKNTAATSVIVHSEDKAFARQLEAELNANINWNDVVDQVNRKEKQDNTVMREEDVTEQEKGSKRKGDSLEQKAVKKQRIAKEEGQIWMFLLVEKIYHLTYFTLEQMVNNVRLKVEEESEMSLELLSEDGNPARANIKQALGAIIPTFAAIGLPLRAWWKTNFNKIARKWGELVFMDDSNNANKYSLCICVKTTFFHLIAKSLKVIIKGKVYVVRAKEVTGWVPDFGEETSDESEDYSDNNSVGKKNWVESEEGFKTMLL